MRNCIAVLFGLVLAARQIIAVTVNFTAAEGYLSGKLRRHPEWIGSHDGFNVNASGTGELSIKNNLRRKYVYYVNSLEAGSTSFEVGIGFSFKRRHVSSLTRSRSFISVELTQGTKPSSNGVALRLQRWDKNPILYQLVFTTSINGQVSFFSSEEISEAQLGFSRASDRSSDYLGLDLKLDKGDDASSWTASCTIKNNRSGEVINFVTSPFKTDEKFFSSNLYPTIGSNDEEAFTEVSKRVIHAFHASSTQNKAPKEPPKKPPKKPNVLFLAVDDLNDWTGLWKGHPDALTPNLDRLALMGLRFTNAHCSVPACGPSRASILSGMRPGTTGLYLNPQKWKNSPRLVEAVTLQQRFQNEGYFTAATGKIFHGKEGPSDVWDEEVGNKQFPEPERSQRPMNGLDLPRDTNFDWGPVEAPMHRFGDWNSAQFTIKKMNEKRDKPFFLACGFVKPHLPWHVPQEYFDRFPLEEINLPEVKKGDLDDIPAAGKAMALNFGDHERITVKEGKWREAVQAYLASTAFMDDSLGLILDALENHPEKNNTIIVLWSDHGWHLGEKMHWRKFALWEEATRVPLIFVVPGMTTPDTKTKAPVTLLDIYPTLLDLAGIPKDPQADGNNLTPLLRDHKGKWDHVAITEHGYKNRSVRTFRWRYILYADDTEELYDHQKDPNEWFNLANQTRYARRKRKLREKLPRSYVKPPEE